MSLAKRVMSIEYQLLRTPVDVLAHRAPADSPLGKGLQRRLASLDLTAGRLLDDDQLARRGEQTLREFDEAERTRRRLDAVDRRTEARKERIDRQTQARLDRVEADQDKAADKRAEAARRRRDAAVFDDEADKLKRQRRR
jgi:hypothetical protein